MREPQLTLTLAGIYLSHSLGRSLLPVTFDLWPQGGLTSHRCPAFLRVQRIHFGCGCTFPVVSEQRSVSL